MVLLLPGSLDERIVFDLLVSLVLLVCCFGASLELLEGKTPPGIAAIVERSQELEQLQAELERELASQPNLPSIDDDL